MQKVAILGGTFNPIHRGHLLLAKTALEQQQLDRVIWVPTHQPPHKARTQLVEFHHRLEMVRRAIASNPAFVCADLEQHRTGVSYAIDTFRDLQSQLPNSRWFWILGIDAFQALPRWRGRRELAVCCQWLVAPRPRAFDSRPFLLLCEQVVQQMQTQGLVIQWQSLPMPLIPVSSSLVRESCAAGRSIAPLVPQVVEDYIRVHQLYQDTSGDHVE